MKAIIRYVLNRLPRRTVQRVAHLATPVAGLLYAGRGVECPVCGRRFRKFMPYGYGPVRGNALCPSCLALERHRLLWLWLRERTDFFTARPRVLHIAPERCFIAKFERLLGDDYVTADLESPLAKVKMDIQAMPFGDGEFDVIFCNHILEHVDDDRLAMREMWRVMRRGGWGVALSPVSAARAATWEDPSIDTPEGRAAAFGQHDHRREYGADYPQRLAEAGFEVEAVPYIESLTPERRTLHGLVPETIWVIRKS
jgi:hypothetical protein